VIYKFVHIDRLGSKRQHNAIKQASLIEIIFQNKVHSSLIKYIIMYIFLAAKIHLTDEHVVLKHRQIYSLINHIL